MRRIVVLVFLLDSSTSIRVQVIVIHSDFPFAITNLHAKEERPVVQNSAATLCLRSASQLGRLPPYRRCWKESEIIWSLFTTAFLAQLCTHSQFLFHAATWASFAVSPRLWHCLPSLSFNPNLTTGQQTREAFFLCPGTSTRLRCGEAQAVHKVSSPLLMPQGLQVETVWRNTSLRSARFLG